MGISFAGALSMLGVKAEKPPKPDTAVVRQHAAMRIIRDWCWQTGRQLPHTLGCAGERMGDEQF